MSQRYPLYFDGIVAGAPAMRTGHSNLATRSVTVALNRVAPKDANGRPVPGGALSDGDRKAIIAKLLDVCDQCSGSGAEPGSKTQRCGTCLGSGEVRRAQRSFFGQFVTV